MERYKGEVLITKRSYYTHPLIQGMQLMIISYLLKVRATGIARYNGPVLIDRPVMCVFYWNAPLWQFRNHPQGWPGQHWWIIHGGHLLLSAGSWEKVNSTSLELITIDTRLDGDWSPLSVFHRNKRIVKMLIAFSHFSPEKWQLLLNCFKKILTTVLVKCWITRKYQSAAQLEN